MNRPLASASALLLALLTASGTASALWTSNVVVNTPAGAGPGESYQPVIAADGAGGCFVVWWDHRNPADSYDIYGQRFDALGRPQWDASGRLLVGGAGLQGAPRIAPDGAGGFVMGYARIVNLANFNDQDVVVQRYDRSGSPLWSPAAGVVIADLPHQIGTMQVESDGSGGLVCVWSDDRSGHFDVYAQRVTAGGTVAWLAEGRPLCTAPDVQMAVVAVADGAGGAHVGWEDRRDGPRDMYYEHVLGSGAVTHGANGFAMCTATGTQTDLDGVADGQGGAIFAWSDFRDGSPDVYAARMTSDGQVWAFDGSPVVTGIGVQTKPRMVSDGAAGAFVAFTDEEGGAKALVQRMSDLGTQLWAPGGVVAGGRPGSYADRVVADDAGGVIVLYDDYSDPGLSLYAQRLDADGVAQWAVNGVPVSRAPGSQINVAATTDGRGGLIAAWEDQRAGTVESDIYAQRIEAFGFAGLPEPVIASVRDVPNDQGGKVKVSWQGSWPERPPVNAVDVYHLFRSVPEGVARERIGSGVRVAGEAEGCTAGDCLLATDSGFWEWVGSQNGFDLTSYSYLVPTTGDSVAGSNPLTRFMVQARASSSGTPYWNSAPDSGYSVDDLAPATPAPFTGSYAAGVATLQWGANGEADLAGYRLHRGTSAGFTPGPGNLVAATGETHHQDAAGAPRYYKLAAVDVHGNLSGYALLLPDGTLDAPPPTQLPREIALAPVRPNPARGPVAFRLALPAATRARLVVFDAQGREVRQVVDRAFEPGVHEIVWDAADESRRPVRPGVYLARLEARDERPRSGPGLGSATPGEPATRHRSEPTVVMRRFAIVR